jgi:cell division protein FtsW
MAKKQEKNKLNKKQQIQYEKSRTKSVKRQRRHDDDRVHLFSRGKNFDIGLILIVAILLTVGFVMILSASGPYSLRTEGDSYFYFRKQIEFAVIGIVLMFMVSKLDYRILNSRLSWIVYLRWTWTYGTCYGSGNWC